MSDTSDGNNGKNRGPKRGGGSGGPRRPGGQGGRDGDGGPRQGRSFGGAGPRAGRPGGARSAKPDAADGSAGDAPRKSGGFRRDRTAGAEGRGEGRGERPSGGAPRRFGKPAAASGEGARGADRPRKPFRPREDGDAAAGERPRKTFRPRPDREGGDGEARRPRRERPAEASGDTPRRSFKREDGCEEAPRRPRRNASPDSAEGAKPFRPRSHGMLSHGPRPDADGKPARPKSYGRLAPDAVATERKRPRRDASSEASERGERPARRERSEPVAATGTMRIAKRLARAGIASRRDAEGMIADGRIKVNGTILDTPARDVTGSDHIEVDGAPLPAIERTRLWLFHKPQGLVTTNRDPEGRPTVFDRLPEDMPRVLSIGRLDINTEGLLLLTNDGGLARILELPSTGWLRRYRVRAHGAIDQAKLDELRQGIAIDGVFYGAVEATLDREQGSNVWLTVGLREGKNREVKRILGHLGLDVNRLIRISFGPFQLGELEEGAVREIRGRTLRDQLGERLIEESGADFDAPIANVFPNAPVAAAPAREGGAKSRKPDSEWISASDTAPNKKKARNAKREDALGRLDTRARPAGGGEDGKLARRSRPERGDGERPQRAERGEARRGRDDDKAPSERPSRPPMGGKRSANVWMAPGARPQGKPKADAGGTARPKSPSDRPAPAGGKGPRGTGGPRGGKPQRPDRG
ncbi:pseudouridine synthase [Mangrovicella endophytica]|uniref:pseudouridine synthase n=1 Tax=Mangrovicella endophytica TaxID=2066697 RepID=UPI000C9DF778|nr:pseudouridine synthase [Mangrovicella endophytica]